MPSFVLKNFSPQINKLNQQATHSFKIGRIQVAQKAYEAHMSGFSGLWQSPKSQGKSHTHKAVYNNALR